MRGLLTLVAALLALSWMPLRAAAGSLSGTVSNPAGAALPGATVLLQNLATKEILTAVTNGNGFYAFSALPDGAYELRIEQRNFRPYAKDGVLLAPGAALKMDIRLEPESNPPRDRRPLGRSPAHC